MIRPERWLFACVITCAAIFGLTQPEARADDKDIISTMSAGRIERILKSFPEVKNFKELDDGTYGFELNGLKVILVNKGETMLIGASFRGKVTLSRMNEWNRTKRFSRAYTDKEGDPVIEADIELTGGVTERNVKEWIKTFAVSLNAFKKHLED